MCNGESEVCVRKGRARKKGGRQKERRKGDWINLFFIFFDF